MADLNDLLIRIDATTEQLRREVKRAESAIDQSTKRIDKDLEKVDNRFVALAKTAAKVGGAMAAAALAAGGVKLIQVARETDILDAQLKTATGSAEAAAQAFTVLEGIAAETPYSLDQVVNGFVKLKNMGLDPSREALMSYGNTASAMGKSLDQMIEAVADAATAEFERLKEFGIRAKNQGATVDFTFRGITTTVRNNAAEIEGYLRRLGEVEFAGAMAERAASLDGALSNLGDSWDGLFRTIARGPIGDVIEEHVRKSVAAVERLADMVARLQGTATPEQELSGQLDDLFVRRQVLERQLAGLDDRKTPYLEGLRAQLEAVKDQIDGTREALNYFKAQAGSLGSGRGAIEEVVINAKRIALPKGRKSEDPFDGGAAALERESQRIQDAFGEVDAFFQGTRTETEQLQAQILRVQELAAQGFFAAKGIDDQQILERLNAQMDALGQNDAAIKIADQLRSNIGGAVDEMFASGELSAGKFFDSVLRDIARVATQLLIVKPLMDSLFGPAGGPIGGIFGSIFGGARANGGPVAPGKAYLVGERGPEMFMPSVGGRISSSSGVKINVHNYGGAESPVQVKPSTINGELVIDVMVERAVGKMFANGAIDRQFRAASMPVRRLGSR